jgi:hypothetical protein
MHFEDLSSYQYWQASPLHGVRNVGWLEPGHAFNQGQVDEAFTRKLTTLMNRRNPAKVHVNMIRGVRPCALCGADVFDQLDPSGDLLIGSSEIWIPSGDKKGWFAAPSMLLHYVVAHAYLPPAEFIAAAMTFRVDEALDAQAEYDRLVGVPHGS